jgi:hypothetical protein
MASARQQVLPIYTPSTGLSATGTRGERSGTVRSLIRSYFLFVLEKRMTKLMIYFEVNLVSKVHMIPLNELEAMLGDLPSNTSSTATTPTSTPPQTPTKSGEERKSYVVPPKPNRRPPGTPPLAIFHSWLLRRTLMHCVESPKHAAPNSPATTAKTGNRSQSS